LLGVKNGILPRIEWDVPSIRNQNIGTTEDTEYTECKKISKLRNQSDFNSVWFRDFGGYRFLRRP